MRINGSTKVYGVIGNPISHSLSPMMQNLYLERTGLDGVYAAFRVEEEQLGAMISGAAAMHLAGINVTVPHKQKVMDYLKEIDASAKAIGAVNTLVPIKGGFKGYNTDAEGLKRAIQEAGIRIRGQNCILLGAGGAAKAAAYVLAREGAKIIYVLNRSRERAELLAEEINRLFDRKVMIALALTEHDQIPLDAYLAVQTTSAGMYPNVDQAPIEDPAFYQKVRTAVDIVYTPAETRFMKYVKAAGGKAVGGLDMLIYQGLIAFELWNPGVSVDTETIETAKKQMRQLLEGN